ncbi:MAG: calcium/sodium antiporter [Alphaproteobacteria bacterium]
MNLGSIQDFGYFGAGFIALLVGGQFTVRGAIGLGQILRFSPLFMGLVIVAFGATLPELVVTLTALGASHPDLAIGNLVGANIVNILLVLGLAALIHPIAVRKAVIFRDGFMMVLSTATVVWIAQNVEKFSTFQGVILVGALVIFVLLSFVLEQVAETPAGERLRELGTSHRLPIAIIPLDIILIGIGIVLLHFGAKYVIDGAAALSLRMHVSEAVIGLSLLALATSMPELVATIAAAARQRTDVLIATILGSNIFNLLAVLGVACLIQAVPINPRIAHLDMWIMFAAAAILVPFMLSSWRLSRAEGLALVVGFFAYMAVLYTGFGIR